MIKRLIVLAILGVLAIAVMGADSCGTSSSITTTADSSSDAASTVDHSNDPDNVYNLDDSGDSESSEDSAPPPPKTLHVGSAATLTGFDNVQMRVTLVKVIDPLQGGEYDEPDAGKRYVGIVIRLTNTGATAYDDAPSNGATLLLSNDEQASSTLLIGGECESSSFSSVKIAPGGSRRGCIAFEVPANRKATAFQFALDSGFSDQTGEWKLR